MNMKQNLFVAFALLMLLPAVAWAKPRTKAEMKKTAASAINLQTTLSKHRLNAPNQNGTRRTATQLRELKQTNTYTVFGYTNGGFAVISADDSYQRFLEFRKPTSYRTITLVSTGG